MKFGKIQLIELTNQMDPEVFGQTQRVFVLAEPNLTFLEVNSFDLSKLEAYVWVPFAIYKMF